jgi:hypothetical protein
MVCLSLVNQLSILKLVFLFHILKLFLFVLFFLLQWQHHEGGRDSSPIHDSQKLKDLFNEIESHSGIKSHTKQIHLHICLGCTV